MSVDAPRPDYAALNRDHLWNPFTQMKGYLEAGPLVIERGEGVRLYDVEGNAFLDGNSSLWVNIHGHNRPELNGAITDQLGRIAHSTLLGLGNVPAIELAARLTGLAPEGLAKVFFSDSGATAVEIGLKLAFAYWRRVGRPEKCRFLSFRNAYHGDTVGAMSLGGIDLFHDEFGPLLFSVERAPYPDPYRFDGSEEECVAASLDMVRRILERKSGELACAVVEPLVQGAAGMIVSPPGFLAGLAALCREHGVLLLADEVATGFGRTGRMFACEHEGVAPDLLALGKGLTGGYLPVAATLVTDEIYDAFWGEHSEQKTFFHGHSFTGNQLGCAVANASLALYETDRLLDHVQGMEPQLADGLKGIAELEHAGEVRRRGLMVGVELVEDRAAGKPYPWQLAMGARVCRRARDLGMITRPLGDVVVFLPPLATGAADLEEMTAILCRAIQETTER
ncbi:MAG TPA: adenosylmethionine--8-amino-7-oxononanoate transaminase [Actinomycetota bacterium]|nr:adenosylmethionine--8-amino-7-oxononanoate transaminase [Actinomycetota bacterium]